MGEFDLHWVSFISSLKVLYTTVNKFISCAYKQNKSFLKHVKLTVFPHSLYFSITYIKREKTCTYCFQDFSQNLKL